MSKQFIPFAVPDLSAFAKSLRARFTALDRVPTHLEMLNLIAKAAGHENFQSLRAGAIATNAPAIDHARIEKVLRHFDSEGIMIRWPGRTNHQMLCLWAIWSRIPPEQRFSEREINQFIIDAHSFGDHAILRRSLVDARMLARTPDGKLYRRIDKTPSPDALALLAAIGQRHGIRGSRRA